MDALITLFILYVAGSWYWAKASPGEKNLLGLIFGNCVIGVAWCVCMSVWFIVSLPERVLAKMKKKDSSSEDKQLDKAVDQQLGKAIEEWHKRHE